MRPFVPTEVQNNIDWFFHQFWWQAQFKKVYCYRLLMHSKLKHLWMMEGRAPSYNRNERFYAFVCEVNKYLLWLVYWYTRAGCRLTMMQWSNLTKYGLLVKIVPCGPHTSSIGVAALGFRWYKSSHPDPQKSPHLQIWPHHWYILLPSQVFLHVGGTENSQMVPNQNIEGDQPVQSHSHAQQPLQPQTRVQEHCPGETGLPLSIF